jgi:CRP-like cAMP-binding protein
MTDATPARDLMSPIRHLGCRAQISASNSSTPAQVAFLLLEHAEMSGDGPPVLQLSHDVIAQLLGARRQSVSRVLGGLRDRGLVTTAYRRLVLEDPDGLQAVAGPSLPSLGG